MKKILIVMALSVSAVLAGCQESTPSTTQSNARAVEENQQRLQRVQPAPRLDTSLERANLNERLSRLNANNMSGYIYLLSQGQVMAFFPVRGKVTSLNAYLMAGEVPTRFNTGAGTSETVMVEQPDYDGAYGENDGGVFFFTADTNTYVEWKGEYIFSDQPLKLNTQPRLERQVQ